MTISRRTVFLAVTASAHLLLSAGCQTPQPDETSVEPPSDQFPVPERLVVSKEDLTSFSRERLVVLMGHDLPWTRLAAARVLAERGVSSIPIFKESLDHTDWRVVRAAQDGLIAMLTTAKKEDQPQVYEALLTTIPALRETLQNDHYYVRMGALECFKAMGPDAKVVIDDICPCFNDEDFLGVAPRAAAVIKAIGVTHVDPEVMLPVLSQAVRSVNVSVRAPAIDLIAGLKEADQRRLVPDMLQALRTPMRDGYTRFQVQGRVASVLEDLEVEEVLPLMIAILNQRGWGESHRISTFLPKIMTYGDKAVAAIPAIQRNIERMKELSRDREDNAEYMLLVNAMKTLRGEAK